MEVGPVVDEQDARRDDGAGVVEHTSQGHGLAQRAPGVDHDRSEAHRLLGDGAQVPTTAVGQVGAEAVHHLGVVEQEVEGPGERGRRRVVAGEDHGEEVVEDLVVVELVAVAVGAEQQGEHVSARREVRCRVALRDLLRERVDHVGPDPLEARPRGETPQIAAGRRVQDEQGARLAEERCERAPQRVEPVDGVDTERHTEDDLDRDRLQPCVQRERPTDGPRPHVVDDDGLHRVGVGREGIGPERAGQEPSLPIVERSVLAQERSRTEERLEERAVRRDLVRFEGEDVADGGGVGEDDGRADAGDADREPVTEAAGAPVEVALGPDAVAQRLYGEGEPRARCLPPAKHSFSLDERPFTHKGSQHEPTPTAAGDGAGAVQRARRRRRVDARLARRADVNVAAAYHHFESKRALLRAVFEELGSLDEIRARFDPDVVALLRATPPEEALAFVIQVSWGRMEANAAYYGLLHAQVLQGDPDARAVSLEMWDGWGQQLADFVTAAGVADGAAAGALAEVLRSLVWGMFQEARLTGDVDEERRTERARSAARLLLAG